jgi:dTDP-4-dehydrorhamnose reductase
MLGHKLWQTFRPRFDTWVTLRSRLAAFAHLDLYDPARTIDDVDAARPDDLVRALSRARPHVVVNCVGVVKQRPEAKDPIVTITVNALLPHRLAALCRTSGARLIHISTDCVFSGKTGRYTESDTPDADDLYGRSKLLGEPHLADATALTLRTSIVGRELQTASGVTEWFLGNRGGRVPGFTSALFSGLTTLALSEVVASLIASGRTLSGLYHVSAAPISKYDLLQRLNATYGANVEIIPSEALTIDRSLESGRFWRDAGLAAPGWDEMMAAAAADPTPYDEWRTKHVS